MCSWREAGLGFFSCSAYAAACRLYFRGDIGDMISFCIYVYFILCTCVGETRLFRSGCGDGGPSFFLIAAAQQSLLNAVSRW